MLFRNNGGTGQWLRLKVIGSPSNRAAIGARTHVQTTVGGQVRRQIRDITSGEGYQSPAALTADFGLGSAAVAESITIEWPSGRVEEYRNVTANQTLTITEGEAGALQVAPATLGFGDVFVGRTSTNSFQVVNRAGTNVSGIIGITPPFSIVGGSIFSLNAGATGTVTIVFSPMQFGSFAQGAVVGNAKAQGKGIVEGDSDMDGLRDDDERYIFGTKPQSARTHCVQSWPATGSTKRPLPSDEEN
jgi:hypothetical protein